MAGKRSFDLHTARPLIEAALTAAGYDVIADPAEPDLIQARRGDLSDVRIVVVDSGGQMRFTCVRQLAPEDAIAVRLATGRAARLVRRTDETLTLLLHLTRASASGFAALLADLETLVRRTPDQA